MRCDFITEFAHTYTHTRLGRHTLRVGVVLCVCAYLASVHTFNPPPPLTSTTHPFPSLVVRLLARQSCRRRFEDRGMHERKERRDREGRGGGRRGRVKKKDTSMFFFFHLLLLSLWVTCVTSFCQRNGGGRGRRKRRGGICLASASFFLLPSFPQNVTFRSLAQDTSPARKTTIKQHTHLQGKCNSSVPPPPNEAANFPAADLDEPHRPPKKSPGFYPTPPPPPPPPSPALQPCHSMFFVTFLLLCHYGWMMQFSTPPPTTPPPLLTLLRLPLSPSHSSTPHARTPSFLITTTPPCYCRLAVVAFPSSEMIPACVRVPHALPPDSQ
eukprot:Rhum_TRINITY_DN14432_c2_g1::Rhum_TRINITY_DN14432_c2_g1_i1::g.90907::m.90907